MKFSASFSAALVGAAVAAPLPAAPAPVQPLVLSEIKAHDSSSSHAVAVAAVGTKAFFGDTACPCIGFDNIQGETTIDFEKEGGEVAYPADLGSRCEAWDNGRHPTCLEKEQKLEEGEKPEEVPGFCGKMWCYVDACNCNIDILPKVTNYLQDARYRGKPIFYSYATCGTKDEFTEKVPEVGSHGCRCIGFDNVPGTTEITMEGGEQVAYPAEIGGSCRAWDAKTHPDCQGKKPASWCKASWCYVDPCSCSIKGGAVPKISMYLPDASFTGKSLYYSYETCGSPDTFTEEYHTNACVNQETKDGCDINDRCTWTGKRCLGSELVDHPLCKGVAKKFERDLDFKTDEKSAAAPRAALFAAFAALAAGAAAQL